MRTNKILNAMFVGAMALCTLTNAYASGSDKSLRAEGAISAISASSVTVSAKTFALNSSTKLEDALSNHIGLDRFQVGDLVEVKGALVDGSLVATEMELSSDLSSGADDSSGHNSSGNSAVSSPKRSIKAKLLPVAETNTQAKGKLELKVEKAKANRGEARFKSAVKIPVPSTIPAVASEADLAGLELTLVLSRAGVDYASCTFQFDSVHVDSASGIRGEYKIDIKSKSRNGNVRLRAKKGSCDIDLAADGQQAGVPAIQSGDVASVKDANGVAFLSKNL